MYKLFVENKVLAIFIVPLFLVLQLTLNHFFSLYPINDELNLGLFGIHSFDSIIEKQILGALMVLINAFFLNYVFNSNGFYEKSALLPSFIYVVWLSYFEEFYYFNEILLLHTFFILMILQLFKLNQNEDGRKYVFNLAFFAGIACCLNIYMIVVLPLLFIMVWTFRPIVFRESLLILLGFVVPLIYAGAYVLIMSDDKEIFTNDQIDFNFYAVNFNFLLFVLTAFCFVVISLMGLRTKQLKSSIRFKKQINVLWIFFLLFIIVAVISHVMTQEPAYFSLLFIVLSFFSFFSFTQKPLLHLADSLLLFVIIVAFLKFFLK